MSHVVGWLAAAREVLQRKFLRGGKETKLEGPSSMPKRNETKPDSQSSFLWTMDYRALAKSYKALQGQTCVLPGSISLATAPGPCALGRLSSSMRPWWRDAISLTKDKPSPVLFFLEWGLARE
jgi:hypothetical protein